MFATIKAELAKLKRDRPGSRFVHFYERHRQQSGWTKAMMVVAAVLSLAIGIILVFIPGPAIVFFAISAALIGMQSRVVAQYLDRFNLAVRRRLRWLRTKYRHLRQGTKRAS